MKNSKDIELHLLQDPQGSTIPDSEKVSHNSNRRTHRSRFIDQINPDFPEGKYAKNVSFLKWITFLEMIPHIKRLNASQKNLDIVDIPPPDKHYNVEAKIYALDYYWSQELEKRNPSF